VATRRSNVPTPLLIVALLASLAAFILCFGWFGVGASVLIAGHELLTGSRRSRYSGSTLEAITFTFAFYSVVGFVIWLIWVTWWGTGATIG
jgi:hypothetical protein